MSTRRRANEGLEALIPVCMLGSLKEKKAAVRQMINNGLIVL